METGNGPKVDLKMERKNLYREEVFTDLKVGTIRKLTPVTPEGDPDLGRKVQFTGETQIMSNMGPLPVNCRIEAASLEEAIDGFPEAVNRAVQEMIEAADEIRRREASRIVIPGQMPPTSRLKMP